MKVKDNQVLGAALQFCKSFSEPKSEAVIFGYAKLLTMDESLVRAIVSEESMGDVEAAHKWFSENNLDLKLIKSGLALVISSIPKSEIEKSQASFEAFLESDAGNLGSKEILQKALDLAFVPFKSIFTEGHELQSIFDYQSQIKAKYGSVQSSEDSEDQKKSGKSDGASDSRSDRGSRVIPRVISGNGTKAAEQYTKYTGGGNDDSKKTEEELELANLEDLSKKCRELSTSLLEVVKGQDHAVNKFVQGYFQGELLKRTEKKNQPKAFFFFFGPPGVGKTLLAETSADILGVPFKVFNMSEFSTPNAHDDLIGVSKSYAQAKEGELTGFVQNNPNCLLLFDEIEKAHLNVIRQFLQILGSGKLQSRYSNKDVDFRDTTIIFTSNVGKDLYADRSVNLSTLPEKVLIDAVQKEKNQYDNPALPPEIVSRIASGSTILFNHLSVRHLTEIVRDNFDSTVAGMKKEYDVNISYAKELPLLLLFFRGNEIDARVAVSQSRMFLKNEIYELLKQSENGDVSENDIKNMQFDIEWDGMAPELTKLFKNSDSSEVLVFSDNQSIVDSISGGQYKVYKASTLDEAEELLKRDISAIFIDPFLGTGSSDETVLSISDYNTSGIKLFSRLMESQADIPVFLLEFEKKFSEADRRTFLQEGATGTISANSKYSESFKREFNQIMEELYMEKASQDFTKRGWVIDFKTKQELTGQKDSVKIRFYDLKKRMAVDVESRGSILSDTERPNVHFDDVIGAENAKEELKYFVNYLQNPKKFLMNGGKPPKGVLLYGPPGTGKTMLARAMAGESDVAFLQTSATEFMNKYVGESEANIRRIFAKAKRYAPSIIFIDEIDAIGKKRTGSEFSAHTEGMLNALLTEMDGFSSSDNSRPVFVLAATNFGAGNEKSEISSLDDALIRRFDNKIYVDLPKEEERKTYVLLTLKKLNIDTVSEKTAQSIAERTTGMSLAIIQNVIELAQRNATKEQRKLEDDDLLTALEDYLYGEKKEHTKEYYQKVAIHETGHAYMSFIYGDKPSYITIESRGNFGGYMQHSNQEDIPEYTKEELLARIRTCLAGRAAEKIFFGDEKSLNTGASSDLEQATNYAWRIICTFGMENDQLIVLNKADVLNSPMASEYVKQVNEILGSQMKRTIEELEKDKDKIQRIADVLVKENRLTGAQFEELMGQN